MFGQPPAVNSNAHWAVHSPHHHLIRFGQVGGRLTRSTQALNTIPPPPLFYIRWLSAYSSSIWTHHKTTTFHAHLSMLPTVHQQPAPSKFVNFGLVSGCNRCKLYNEVYSWLNLTSLVLLELLKHSKKLNASSNSFSWQAALKCGNVNRHILKYRLPRLSDYVTEAHRRDLI